MNRKGFTLVEVLMTIIVLGVIASIAIPRFIHASDKARSAEAIQLLKASANAIKNYEFEKDVVFSDTNLDNLDVYFAPDYIKYFGYPQFPGGTPHATLPTAIVWVAEKNGKYELGIDNDLNIVCSSTSGYCEKLGY